MTTFAPVAEVEALHAFFTAWYRGELAPDPAELARFAEVLDAAFEIIGPDGVVHDRDAIIRLVRDGHASRRDDREPFTIEIRAARGRRVDDGLAIVVYEEWQRRVGTWHGRLSTALLRVDETAPCGARWLHVHECGI